MTKPIDTAPAMALPPQAMDHLGEELRAYHAIYRPLLQRREQREGAAPYLHGLLLDLPRKSSEPMGLALEGAQAQAGIGKSVRPGNAGRRGVKMR